MGCGASAEGGLGQQGTSDLAPIQPGETVLRIVAINDVYELKGYPALKTLVDAEKKKVPPGAGKVIVTMAGDFLGPSLLSSLDHGKSMVRMLNALPTEYICFGNHEDDIPFTSQKDRIRQFKGKWLNSNMPDYGVKLPEYDILTVPEQPSEAQPARKVGFMGLCMGGPVHGIVFKPGGFDGAVDTMEDVLEAAPKMLAKIKQEVPDVNCVVPITHQLVAEDVKLALTGSYPVVLGGHEHEPFTDVHNGVPVLKAGADNEYAVVCELRWPAGAAAEAQPQVSHVLKKVGVYAKDKHVQELQHIGEAPEREMQAAIFYTVPEGQELDSVGVRLQAKKSPTWLLSVVRDVMHAQVAICGSGFFRGEVLHAEGAQLTFADFRALTPYDNAFCNVSVPGRVLAKGIVDSRAKWLDKKADAQALQCDDGVRVEEVDGGLGLVVTHVNGAPLENDKNYSVALRLYDMSKEPAFKHFQEQYPGRVPDEEAGRSIMPIVLEHCCNLLWKQLVDEDGDGVVSEEEMLAFVSKTDVDGTGSVDKKELAQAVREKLGNSSNVVVSQMMALMDEDNSGHLNIAEVKKGLGL